jgi:peptide/nickel transport system permease protein
MGHVLVDNRGLVAGALVLLVLLGWAIALPLPFDPRLPDPAAILAAPSAQHWFGADQNGIDVFSRTIAAARNDIPLAFGGALLAGLFGVPVGLALSRNGRVQNAMVRFLDVLQSLPLIVVALTVVALAGNGVINVLVALALINVVSFIRLARSEALTVRTLRFVEAIRAVGAPEWWITLRHVLRNILPVAFTELSLSSGQSLLTLAALGFLGVGVQPTTPSWGLMLNTGTQFITSGQWWVFVFPILAIIITVLSFNAVARGLSRLFARGDT